jgi:hypothetical protein
LATEARNGAPPGIGSPPDLSFAVEGVEVDRFAVVPTLRFKLAVARVGGGDVRSIALNTQIRISATRRSYGAREQERLVELFGEPGEWSRSLRSFSWANATLQVPAFSGETTVDLPMVCTYDFEVTTAQYFHALDDGEVPLELLFSGTLFYSEGDGGLRVSHIPWEKEAEYRLPVATWREMMDRFFPNSAWLRLRRESFDRLHAYKARGGHLTWEDAVEALLLDAERGTGP